MSAIFFKHKRRKRDPIAIFSLKNPDTFIVKLRRTHEKLDFLTIDRNKYQISNTTNTNIIQLLLNKMSLNDINHKSNDGETPLDYCYYHNDSSIRQDIITLIRKHGGKGNFYNTNGK